MTSTTVLLMKSCVSMSFIPVKNNVFLIPLISALTLAFNGRALLFYADYLACVLGYEIVAGTRAGIKVINKLVTGQSGKVARYFVEVVGLFGVGLIERFGTHQRSPSISSKMGLPEGVYPRSVMVSLHLLLIMYSREVISGNVSAMYCSIC